MLVNLPPEVLQIMHTVQAAGGQAYVVGGALRDLLLGNSPVDWDIAATIQSEALLALFPGSLLTGGVCGTVTVPLGEYSCEVTPCRTEGEYTDNRHPDEVNFVPDILADLSRRDFTVNAMAYNGDILLDPFGGQIDLQAKRLRCVGRPEERFAEDALRILRLFRFAATLGFTAELGTFAAANNAMPSISSLSVSRVREEMVLILRSGGPQVLGPLIAKGGLASYGFNFAPNLSQLCKVPNQLLCRWWGLIKLCGANTQEVAAAFGFSGRFCAQLAEMDTLCQLGPSQDAIRLKQKISTAKIDYAPVSAAFAAINPDFKAEPTLFAGVQMKHEPYRIAHLAINGDILRHEGLRGERCGRVLDELLAAVIKTPSLNRLPVLLGMARGLEQIL